MGAAIHAASLVAPTQQSSYLLDVTPLSLRIGVAGGLAEPVIERNTPVPIEQTRSFTTVQDNQERVKIRVYQGESRRAEENELLGQFEFSGFKKAPRGEVRIDVTFEINGDGIVNVTACERESGQQASTEIMLSSGLTEQEIAKILAQRRTDRVQTVKAPGAPARPEPAARPAPKAPPAAPAPAARPAPPPPPVVASEAPLAAGDDDLDVLPDDDDLEAVLEEVGAAAGAPAPAPSCLRPRSRRPPGGRLRLARRHPPPSPQRRPRAAPRTTRCSTSRARPKTISSVRSTWSRTSRRTTPSRSPRRPRSSMARSPAAKRRSSSTRAISAPSTSTSEAPASSRPASTAAR